MTEEEFLGYEAEPVQEEKKNFFETIAGNPRIPIFAFLGLVLLVAIGFGVVSLFSGSNTPSTSPITLNQPRDNKASITPEEPSNESVNLPKDTTTLNTENTSLTPTSPEVEGTEQERPEPSPEKTEAENQLKQELLAARDDQEERKQQPEYKAIKVDNKENLKITSPEIKIEQKTPKKEEVIVEKSPEKASIVENPPPPAVANPAPPKKEERAATSSKKGDYGSIYKTGNYRKLTPELMNELVKSIDYRFQKIGKKNNACIEMNAISGNDRALSYAKEVQSFLRGQGYDVSPSIKQVYLTKPVQDVWVWFNNDCVSLTVGTPKN